MIKNEAYKKHLLHKGQDGPGIVKLLIDGCMKKNVTCHIIMREVGVKNGDTFQMEKFKEAAQLILTQLNNNNHGKSKTEGTKN